MKVVINTCFGGYRLSEEACQYLNTKNVYEYIDDRTNSKLVKCIETLGEKASGIFADLHVVEIPDDVNWYIDEYDGKEIIREKHRIWGNNFE